MSVCCRKNRWCNDGLPPFCIYVLKLRPKKNTIMHDFSLKPSFFCRCAYDVFIVWEHCSDLVVKINEIDWKIQFAFDTEKEGVNIAFLDVELMKQKINDWQNSLSKIYTLK